MTAGRRHPSEVTADRLTGHYERWYDRLTDQEREVIGTVRAALHRIADEDLGARAATS
ncbi:hypothetical protein [Kitasatospora aureofaciens]|uniref:hypothetical protein n=1 Tax=Kitasatospora aureofaciens TaxID=1894 RepID=UPI000AD0DF7E|nr:hypothetical protein [Kitasatospora aureofaciens]